MRKVTEYDIIRLKRYNIMLKELQKNLKNYSFEEYPNAVNMFKEAQHYLEVCVTYFDKTFEEVKK